jgi:hypothetical protein
MQQPIGQHRSSHNQQADCLIAMKGLPLPIAASFTLLVDSIALHLVVHAINLDGTPVLEILAEV